MHKAACFANIELLRRISEFCVAGRSAERNDVADVLHAREVHDETLEAETEARVLDAAVLAQIEVPPVIFLVEFKLFHTLEEQVEALLSLRAADDLAHAGDEHIDRGDRLAVVVEAHIERLDLLGIIGDEDRLFENLFGEESFVLGLKVCAPVYGVLELVFVLFEDLDSLRIGDLFEVACHDMVESLDETFVHKVVEELHFFGALLEDVLYDVLDHIAGKIHIRIEVCERDLGFYHPELSRMAVGVALLRSERRTKGIDVAEREREALRIELTADGKICTLAEEVLRKIHAAVLFERRILGVEGRYTEHFARTLAVAARDERRVDVYKIPRSEECVYRLSRDAPHSEHGEEGIRSRAEVRYLAQELETVPLFLKRILRRRSRLYAYALRLDLIRLLRVRGDDDGTDDAKTRADVLRHDVFVPVHISVRDDLRRLEFRAVVQLYERKILAVSYRPDPTVNLDGLTVQRGELLAQLPQSQFLHNYSVRLKAFLLILLILAHACAKSK